MVVVTDVTIGVRDTMTLLKPSIEGLSLYFYYYDYHTKENTRVSLNRQYIDCCKGLCITTKTVGIEGHSYHVDISRNGKHHQSDIQRMEPALVFTDMKVKMFDFAEKGKHTAPCISFINPAGVENYYIFQIYPLTYTHFWFFAT